MAYRTTTVKTAAPKPKATAIPLRTPAKTTRPGIAPINNSINLPTTLEGPGAGEQFYGKTGGFYTKPTETLTHYRDVKDKLAEPSKTGSLFEDVKDQFTMPQAGEQFISDLYPTMTEPGIGQQFIDNMLSSLSGQMGDQNQAQQAWQEFLRNRPDVANEPGLGAYYENAKRRAAESISQKMAAQGAYGSSASGDLISEAMTNLEADRAGKEAAYNLSKLAEQRAWEDLGGQLAGQASSQQLGWTTGLGQLGLSAEGAGLAQKQAAIEAALGVDKQALDRLTTGLEASQNVDQLDLARILGAGEMATSADVATLNRIMAGQGAATGAQELLEGRAAKEADILGGMAGQMAPYTATGFEGMFQSDKELQDAIAAALLGGGAQGIQTAIGQFEGMQNNLANLINTISQYL